MAKKTTGSIIDVSSNLLPTVVEDQELVHSAGAAILAFLKGVAGFFLTASAIESDAIATLSRAKALTLPANVDEDAAVQKFIKATAIQIKVAEEHWSITKVISAFHRRTTAARARATEPLEEARKIGNRLHNTYVDEENRRAAAEAERLRQENERKAAEERQRELDRLEEEAIKLEAASSELSARETVFVEAMFTLKNATAAAQRAGFKNPMQASTRLLTMPKVCAALEAKRQAAAIREQSTARAAAPLVYDEPEVKPEIAKHIGTSRTTWSGKVLDRDLLWQAFMEGKHGIPADIWVVDPVKLNDYARSLKDKMNFWPGAQAVKTTGLV